MATIAELTPHIVAAWQHWPDGRQRILDVHSSYQHLERERPELLASRCVGDKYQRLKVILAPYCYD